jgi:hypothetical protein
MGIYEISYTKATMKLVSAQISSEVALEMHDLEHK